MYPSLRSIEKSLWGLENRLFTDGEDMREMPSVFWLKVQCLPSTVPLLIRGCSAE
jgi:hypothetical protein